MFYSDQWYIFKGKRKREDYPKGCHLFHRGERLEGYFNSDSSGRGNPVSKALCKLEKDPEISSACITVGGNIVGHSCKFPFYYSKWNDYPYVPASFLRWFPNGIKFESCTGFGNDGKLWCATKVTSDNRYIPGHWGECPETSSCGAVKL